MDEKTANAVYTKEDFINGSAPFEEVYALRENPLELTTDRKSVVRERV